MIVGVEGIGITVDVIVAVSVGTTLGAGAQEANKKATSKTVTIFLIFIDTFFEKNCLMVYGSGLALRVGKRGLCLGAEKPQSLVPLQIRPVYIESESLPRFKCRIWGHRTRSVASGRVAKGWVGPRCTVLAAF